MSLFIVAASGCGAPPDDATGEVSSSALSTGCGEGSEPSIEIGGACAPIDDLTAEAATPDPTLPSLADERSGTASNGSAVASATCTAAGSGTGTWYQLNKLPATTETDLQTKMFVDVHGIGNTSPCDFFTTATNGKQRGVEVLGFYPGKNAAPFLAVFDWSCTKADPCTVNHHPATQPTYVWTHGFEACYLQNESDGHGHTVSVEYYANKTRKLKDGNPPQWQNSVLHWNHCTKHWSLIYAHTYREANGPSGGWGPIIESHLAGNQPSIAYVGYKDSALLHDGKWSTLGPDVTTFDEQYIGPKKPDWDLVFDDANRSYGIKGR
jgi:hypothetical protein